MLTRALALAGLGVIPGDHGFADWAEIDPGNIRGESRRLRENR